MQFLNKHIEILAKKRGKSLVRKHISCGIFQEIEPPEEYHTENTHRRKNIKRRSN